MKTILVAHRGAQQIAPENTLSAFRLAGKGGYKVVECDVQLSSDGELFVIHDEDVERTTNGSGWVSRLSSSKLKSLKITGNEHIPTLQETVDEVIGRLKLGLIIELKADTETHSFQVAYALGDFVSSLPLRYRQHIEVHSFWYEALKQFKRQNPGIETAAIINGGFSGEEVVKIARQFNTNGVSLGFEFVSKKVVKQCHKSGLFVDTWAVSDKTVMRRLRPFGLKAIVENFTGTLIH